MTNQTKLIVAACIGAALLPTGVLLFVSGGTSNGGASVSTSESATTTIVDGVQYIDIAVQAGYSPRTTRAQANMPTVIRATTNNTYDCSSALVVPALNYQAYLEPTGTAEITVPLEKTTGTLEGQCSMGMYSFDVVFE